MFHKSNDVRVGHHLLACTPKSKLTPNSHIEKMNSALWLAKIDEVSRHRNFSRQVATSTDVEKYLFFPIGFDHSNAREVVS